MKISRKYDRERILKICSHLQVILPEL